MDPSHFPSLPESAGRVSEGMDPAATSSPSQLQVAFAIAIVKSTPRGMTAREYILQLRKQLGVGKLFTTEHDHQIYLDTVGFLRDQNRRLEQEIRDVRHMNARLERSNIALAGEQADLGSPFPNRKREAFPKSSDGIGVEEFECFEKLEEGGATLSYHLYMVHKIWKGQRSDPNIMCFHLVEAATALGSILSFIAENQSQLGCNSKTVSRPLTQDSTMFAQALRASARVFMTILFGLQKLQANGIDRHFARRVIYGTVKMFQTALGAINEAAQQTVDALSSRAARSPPKESTASKRIADLLITFLAYLDKKDPDHQEIFDGFVFVLLERIGKQLHYCTFDREEHGTPAEDTTACSSGLDDAASLAKHKKEELVIRYEVRAQISILERAMGLAANHMNPGSSKAQPNPVRLARALSLKNLPITSRTLLSQHAKDRLQRTLVTCMFGEEESDEILDVLRMPVKMAAVPKAVSVEEKDIGAWLRCQVWKLVGWELLAKEGGW